MHLLSTEYMLYITTTCIRVLQISLMFIARAIIFNTNVLVTWLKPIDTQTSPCHKYRFPLYRSNICMPDNS